MTTKLISAYKCKGLFYVLSEASMSSDGESEVVLKRRK